MFHLRGGSPTVFFDVSGGGNAKILTDNAALTISDGTFGMMELNYFASHRCLKLELVILYLILGVLVMG